MGRPSGALAGSTPRSTPPEAPVCVAPSPSSTPRVNAKVPRKKQNPAPDFSSNLLGVGGPGPARAFLKKMKILMFCMCFCFCLDNLVFVAVVLCLFGFVFFLRGKATEKKTNKFRTCQTWFLCFFRKNEQIQEFQKHTSLKFQKKMILKNTKI